jgi:hypothetical protein
MAGLDPAINDFGSPKKVRRGCPTFAGHVDLRCLILPSFRQRAANAGPDGDDAVTGELRVR